MSTKYILHGGMPHHLNSENDTYIKEVLAETTNNPKILLVYFAQSDENIEKCKTQDLAQYNKNCDTKQIEFEVANEKNFIEQIKRSDVIYFRGGNTLKLINTLKDFPDLKIVFKGKIITGESAGVYALSTFFYSKSLDTVYKGLGILPIKAICHYTGENKEKLDECPKEIEYILLPNYTFKVFRSI